MLGKAVKIRHCPATVSAPARRSFWGTPAEGLDRSNHWSRRSGKVIQISASQETGPLCFKPRSEGNGGTNVSFFVAQLSRPAFRQPAAFHPNAASRDRPWHRH